MHPEKRQKPQVPTATAVPWDRHCELLQHKRHRNLCDKSLIQNFHATSLTRHRCSNIALRTLADSDNPTRIKSMFLISRSSYNPFAKARQEEHKKHVISQWAVTVLVSKINGDS